MEETQTLKEPDSNAMEVSATEKQVTTIKHEVEEFKALMRMADAENAKEEDAAALREYLEKRPLLWRACGDLSDLSIRMSLRSRGLSAAMRVSIEKGIQELRQDLGYERAPAIERLLIDQVIVCWVELYKTQLRHAAVHSKDSLNVIESNYWERRLTRAQGRYLRACETLARVQRLLRPAAVQVNIGDQQVNFSTGLQEAQVDARRIRDAGTQIKGPTHPHNRDKSIGEKETGLEIPSQVKVRNPSFKGARHLRRSTCSI